MNEETKMEVCNDVQGRIEQDRVVKDETFKLEKEPKLLLERINVSRSRVMSDWTDPRSVFEQVEEVMNEPLTSESDNDSGSDYEREIFMNCKECNKTFKTEQAYKIHRTKYHAASAPGNKPGWREERKKRGTGVKKKIEEEANPWNVTLEML